MFNINTMGKIPHGAILRFGEWLYTTSSKKIQVGDFIVWLEQGIIEKENGEEVEVVVSRFAIVLEDHVDYLFVDTYGNHVEVPTEICTKLTFTIPLHYKKQEDSAWLN